MDEQMKERLAESLDKVASYVEQGADFAAEQAPLVAQEIVAWGIAEGCVYLALSFLVVFAFGVALWRLVPRAFEEDRKPYLDQKREVMVAALSTVITSALFVPIAILICIESVAQVIKATVAPRLFILEQLGELIR